jgi:hypothetical protein
VEIEAAGMNKKTGRRDRPVGSTHGLPPLEGLGFRTGFLALPIKAAFPSGSDSG